MSRLTVRRVTVAALLLAVLCLSLPAAAATGRPHPAQAPTVVGSGFVDQLLTWLVSLWPGQPSSPERTGQTKSLTAPSSPALAAGLDPTSNTDRGGMIDPNGGW
jgi:hypothetical protein